MAGMQLLQFHRVLCSALEGVSAAFDTPAALHREQPPTYLLNNECGAKGLSDETGNVKSFISYLDM